mgnify:CR=1 FL=1
MTYLKRILGGKASLESMEEVDVRISNLVELAMFIYTTRQQRVLTIKCHIHHIVNSSVNEALLKEYVSVFNANSHLSGVSQPITVEYNTILLGMPDFVDPPPPATNTAFSLSFVMHSSGKLYDNVADLLSIYTV